MRTVTDIIGDLARPFSIYATSGAAAVSTVLIALKAEDALTGAALVAAIYTGLGALYWGKTWENREVRGQEAAVEKERVRVTPVPGTAQIITAPDVDVSVREAVDAGELPESEKLPR